MWSCFDHALKRTKRVNNTCYRTSRIHVELVSSSAQHVIMLCLLYATKVFFEHVLVSFICTYHCTCKCTLSYIHTTSVHVKVCVENKLSLINHLEIFGDLRTCIQVLQARYVYMSNTQVQFVRLNHMRPSPLCACNLLEWRQLVRLSSVCDPSHTHCTTVEEDAQTLADTSHHKCTCTCYTAYLVSISLSWSTFKKRSQALMESM